MPRTPRDVTDAELAVLQLLWNDGCATIRRLTEQLYSGGTASEYATVQKLLERLEAKGYVAHRLAGRAKEFTAVLDREGLIARRLQATADKLCEGSLTPLLTHLVRSASLSGDELRKLRTLVEELVARKGRSPGGDGR
jgi:BlaI family penicillinase repressor